MSQPYPPGGGPPPDQPPYGQQQPTQPYGQQQPQYPQQQQPYPQQPPYGQPQQPPPGYGYPQQQQPYPQQQQAYAAPMPPPVVEADTYERTMSILVYLWVAAGIAFLETSVLQLRNLGYGGFFVEIHVSQLAILLLPIFAPKFQPNSQLLRFHAKQALVIALAYMIVRFLLGFFYLIPEYYTQTLLGGILVGAAQLFFAYLALQAGLRAFFNRELYKAPIVGGMVS